LEDELHESEPAEAGVYYTEAVRGAHGMAPSVHADVAGAIALAARPKLDVRTADEMLVRGYLLALRRIESHLMRATQVLHSSSYSPGWT
jgi:hypothetical protein